MTSIVLLSASEIVRRVLSAPWFDEATTISCYLSMPTGEVDTSAIASAVLDSGAQLPFGFSLPLHPLPLPLFFLAGGFAFFSRELKLTPRKESFRAEGGPCTPGGDGPSQNLRPRGPTLAAEWRLGH
jgi:hypothetical protein